jgi:hypothetical protein
MGRRSVLSWGQVCALNQQTRATPVAPNPPLENDHQSTRLHESWKAMEWVAPLRRVRSDVPIAPQLRGRLTVGLRRIHFVHLIQL